MYYKRKNSHFSFSNHPSHKVLWMTGHMERSECFIAECNGLPRRNEMKTGLPRRNEMKTGAASYCGALAEQCFSRLRPMGYAVPSLKRRFYEARLSPYEAALCAMKRTCGA